MSLVAPALASAPHAFTIRNPWCGSSVGQLAESTDAEIGQAVLRAGRAAADFRFSTPHERRSLLYTLADLLTRNAEEFARLVTAEMGKTLHESRNEMRRAANTLRLSGDAATFNDGEVLHCAVLAGGPDRQAVITPVPAGVVAAITPFNYPVNLLCHKLGPAIAAGNAVVVKPSPKAPLAADRLVKLCEQAGFPPGLVQIVHGGAQAALTLARSPIDLLSFTGGPVAGLALKRASGLVRTLMELGGNDPLFVLPDADLEKAAATAVAHRTEIAGQSCSAAKKLYLHEEIAGEVTGMVLERLKGVTIGDPSHEKTVMGPLIDEVAARDVEERINEAVDAGGRLLAGGKRRGKSMEPAVLTGVPPESRLIATETFGPVIAIRPFSSLDEAAAEINATPFGLQAGIFTNDHRAIRQLTRVLQVGGIMVNEGPDFRCEHVPFGGVRSSGLGREGVRIAMREMSETRVVID